MLCEGHNEAMQNFLYEQPALGTSIDIWTAIVELLITIELELDESNLPILEKCLDTLVEGTQGNSSMVVSHALLDTKLLDAVEKLLNVDRDDMLKIGEEKVSPTHQGGGRVCWLVVTWSGVAWRCCCRWSGSTCSRLD